MNPASNFACYRAMFKMAVESTGGRVSSILSLLCKERPMGYLNDESEQLFLIFFFFFFSLNTPFLSSACLLKMFIFSTRATQTGLK